MRLLAGLFAIIFDFYEHSSSVGNEENISYAEATIIEKIYKFSFEEIQHKNILTYKLPDEIEIEHEEVDKNGPRSK